MQEEKKALHKRGFLYPLHSTSNRSLAHCSVFEQKEMPLSKFSKRLALAEPGLEHSVQKHFALYPVSCAGGPARKTSPHRPRQLMLLGDPAKPDARDAESNTFRSPSCLLALSPELLLFHQQKVTVSQLHRGQMSPPPPNRRSLREGANHHVPRTRPSTAHRPRLVPRRNKPGPPRRQTRLQLESLPRCPSPFTPPQLAPWEESGPGARNRELGLCLGSFSVNRGPVPRQRVSYGFLAAISSTLLTLPSPSASPLALRTPILESRYTWVKPKARLQEPRSKD